MTSFPETLPDAAAVASVAAQRVLVLQPADGQVLFERAADVQGAVASTQKLLTALVVWQEGALDERVVMKEEDLACMPYHLGLQPGESATRRDLVHAILLGSSNDAAMALARSSAGGVDPFAIKMNQVAQELGMTRSHFVNPHGLPDERQHSTARDVARLACRIDATPGLRAVVACREYAIARTDGSLLVLQNRNRLLLDPRGCDGMKTGYTRAAGFCLVSSAGSGWQRRIAVVLNSTEEAVWTDSATLIFGSGCDGIHPAIQSCSESPSEQAA